MKEKYLNKAGAIIVRDRKGQTEILIGHRKRDMNDWTFPKGKVETGESMEEAAQREVWEETGFKVELLGRVSEAIYDFGEDKVRLTLFLAKVLEGNLKMSWENDKLEWFDYNTALKLLSYDNLKEALEDSKKLLTQVSS